MSARVALDAFLGFIISFGGSLGLLFSTPGVAKFSDISQVSYAGAFVLALIATAKLVQSRLADSPANVRQADEIVSAAANLDKQAGFIRSPSFGFGLYVLSFIALIMVLPACTTPPTPNQLSASASVLIEQLAVQIDQLQKTGQISNEREDKLVDELKQIHADLRFAHQLTGPLQTQSLHIINERLTAMQAELAREKQP
jgi:hypothetical protein